MIEIPLKCHCGTVRGKLTLASARAGNHVVCYCKDCQAFANHLSSQEPILDEWGGTRVYQAPPSKVVILSGQDQLKCLRLTRKGLYRWYTGCCQTPIGNTVSKKFPFIGLIHNFIDEGDRADSLLGPIRGYNKPECANGKLPDPILEKGMPVTTLIRVFWRLFKWKITDGGKPNPFFAEDGKSISKPTIVNPG